jgi:D-alanyl-D-alanine carboxypeptidase/D-alanyl-D-alanine-endopeptidase (penicillin-binding protein 4)
VAGLNIDHNRFVARLRPGAKEGDAAEFLGSHPEVPHVIWRSEVTTGPRGSGDGVMIYGGPKAAEIELAGTVPAGSGEFRVSGAVPDPPLLAAHRLTEHLKAAGIEVGKAASTGEREGGIEWARHESAPLVEIISSLHRTSNNLEAEAVFRMVGASSEREPAEAIRSHWMERGLDLGNTRIVDGSGLSRADYISAATLARLQHLAEVGPLGEAYRDSLNPAYEGAVRWKGGAMSAVRSWCGFVRTESGEERAFAMIFNHYPDGAVVSQARDRLVEAMRTSDAKMATDADKR